MKRTPWKIQFIQSDQHRIFHNNLIDTQGNCVAEVYGIDELDQRTALIAAAPDLLEALEAVANSPRGQGLDVPVVIQVMEAIFKASVQNGLNELNKRFNDAIKGVI